MNLDGISRSMRERQEKAQAIVDRLQRLGWEVTLQKVLSNYGAFDRWATGNMSVGYLQRMTGIRRKTMPEGTFNALSALRERLVAQECECPKVREAVEALGPIADSIRSIQCGKCHRVTFIRDLTEDRLTGGKVKDGNLQDDGCGEVRPVNDGRHGRSRGVHRRT